MNQCPSHQKPRKLLCTRQACVKWLLCEDCIHTSSCPGDVIDLNALRNLEAPLDNLIDDYRQEQDRCQQMIEQYHQSMIDLQGEKIQQRIRSIRAIFDKRSSLGLINNIRTKLGDLLSSQDPKVLSESRELIRRSLHQLGNQYYTSGYAQRNNMQVLERSLNEYWRLYKDRVNCEFKNKFWRLNKVFRESFYQESMPGCPKFAYAGVKPAKALTTRLNPFNPLDPLETSRLTDHEQGLVDGLAQVIQEAPDSANFKDSLSYVIETLERHKQIFSVKYVRVLKVGTHSGHFCFSGTVDDAQHRTHNPASAEIPSHVFIGDLNRAKHVSQLGRFPVPEDQFLESVEFLSRDNYLLLILSRVVVVLKIIILDFDVRIKVKRAIDYSPDIQVRSFQNCRFDLAIFKRCLSFTFLRVETSESWRPFTNTGIIEVFQIRGNKCYLLFSDYELYYFDLSNKASKKVDGFREALYDLLEIEERGRKKKTPLAEMNTDSMSRLSQFIQIMGGESSSDKPIRPSLNPIRLRFYQIGDRSYFRICDLEDVELWSRTFYVIVPFERIANLKPNQSFKFLVHTLQHRECIYPNFLYDGDYYKIRRFFVTDNQGRSSRKRLRV